MASTIRHRIDDRLLMQLAVEPARPLFPVLHQAAAMTPLVVVIALLPALFAVVNRRLTEPSALWGLQSLKCLAAADLNEFVDPDGSAATAPLKWQPPLMNWLTAAGLHFLGSAREVSLVAAAFLCTAALVAAGYGFGCRLGDERLGLLTALLLACHPEILKLAQEPVPYAAGLLFALICLWGFLSHQGQATAPASLSLLVAGIALGLCLLACGPLALAVLATLLLFVSAMRIGTLLRARRGRPAGLLLHAQGHSFRALAILAATAFAVGGWWELMMGSRYGDEFWQAWIWWMPVAKTGTLAAARQPDLGTWRQFHELVTPLAWLSLLGFHDILRGFFHPQAEPGKPGRGLPIVWTLVGGGLWMFLAALNSVTPAAMGLGQLFVVVPLILLAAVGLLAIIDRRVSCVVAIPLALCSVIEILMTAGQSPRADQTVASFTSGVDWAMIAPPLASGVIAAVLLGWVVRDSEPLRRSMLAGLVLMILGGSCVRGAVSLQRATPDDRELAALRAILLKLPDVRQSTLVSVESSAPESTESPAQLRYLLRSLWPEAVFSQADSWEPALAALSPLPGERDSGPQILVAWGSRGRAKLPAAGTLLRSLGPPAYFQGLEVTAYVRVAPESVGG